MTRNFTVWNDGSNRLLCDECGAVVTTIARAGFIQEAMMAMAQAKQQAAEHVCGEPSAMGLAQVEEQRRQRIPERGSG